MSQVPREPAHRQQQLAFAANDVWPNLPSEAKAKCRERLARLLEAVVQAERPTGSQEDERQDPH